MTTVKRARHYQLCFSLSLTSSPQHRIRQTGSVKSKSNTSTTVGRRTTRAQAVKLYTSSYPGPNYSPPSLATFLFLPSVPNRLPEPSRHVRIACTRQDLRTRVFHGRTQPSSVGWSKQYHSHHGETAERSRGRQVRSRDGRSVKTQDPSRLSVR